MDIYSKSEILNKNKKIAFLDVDLTLTGLPEMQQKVRNLLERKGIGIVFVTSRPYELVLSDESLNKSPTLTRPQSKLGIEGNGNHYHKNLSEIASFNGLLDPDIVASSTGLELYIKQTTGEYLRDETFNMSSVSPDVWKNAIVSLLETIFEGHLNFSLKPIENVTNYLSNTVGIAPIDCRLQLDFQSLDDKKKFADEFKLYQEELSAFLLDDSEPEYNNYSLYIFPQQAENLKAHAINYVLKKVKTENTTALIAGDSYPDLHMLLFSAKNSNATFYLSGGSRLTKCFTDPNVHNYLDIDITSWKKDIKKKSAGIYEFHDRTIYIGDELFPGILHAESMFYFLQSSYAKLL